MVIETNQAVLSKLKFNKITIFNALDFLRNYIIISRKAFPTANNVQYTYI